MNSHSISLRETQERTGAAFAGFVLNVSGAERPKFRWEAAPNRLRLVVGNEPRLWARSELNWWQPPWFAHCLDRPMPPVIRAISANDVRAIRAEVGSEKWWDAWMRWFVKEIAVSTCSPLYNGRWRLARLQMGPIEKATAWGYLPWDGVPMAHSLGTVHGHWVVWCGSKERSGQGEVVMLRGMDSSDHGRIKAWKKHALNGTLPPILVLYCAPVGIHMILDGHVRLRAAMEAGKEPPLLVLFPVHAREKRSDDEWRNTAWRQAEVDLEKLAALGQRAVEMVNNALVDAFDERTLYTPMIRAWPLPGGPKVWAENIMQLTSRMIDPVVCALRDEMIGNGNIAGRILNRERRLIAEASDLG